jgi:methyl-accepting chemotaxis protein
MMMLKSLKNKMILWIVLPILLVLAISTAITLVFSIRSGQDMVNAQMQETAHNYANQFDSQMASNQMVGRMLAGMMQKYQSNSRQEVLDILHNLLTNHPEALGFYVAYEPNAFDGQDSKFVNSPGHDATGRFVPYWNKLTGKETLDPLADYDTSDYYLLPKKSKTPVVIEPYLYQGVLMASFISPILKDDGSFIGMGGMDVSLNSLDQQTSQVKILKTGYAFMVSNSGIIVAYPDKKAIGNLTLAQLAKDSGVSQLADLAGVVQQGKAGQLETIDPVSKRPAILFYAPIKTANWSLVVVAPVDEMLEDVNNLRNILLLTGVFALIILSVVVTLVASSIIRPVADLKAAASQIANGDLGGHVRVSSQDELGQMAEAFNSMVTSWQEMSQNMTNIASGDLTVNLKIKSDKDVMGHAFVKMTENLRSTLSLVTQSANGVDSASEQLVETARQAGYATSQIATTIQQVAKGINQETESVSKTAASVEQMGRAINGVAKGAQEQAKAVAKASQATTEINHTVDQVASNAAESAHGSDKAARIARAGVRIVHETINDMNSIKSKVGLSAQKMEEMGQRSNQIGIIVETIDDIATQTNLLALNAAIEAARAGEHGKGFAVVADEVRKLAERSSVATKEIGKLVKDIQKTIAEAVSAMNAGTSEVENGVKRAGQSGDALESILKAIELVNQQVEKIAAASQRLRESSGELVNAMDSVSAVVEENTAATEEISANSNLVTMAIENVASVSEENSAAVEEVSASASEMNSQVADVNSAAQSLSEMALELRKIVNQFKLK